MLWLFQAKCVLHDSNAGVYPCFGRDVQSMRSLCWRWINQLKVVFCTEGKVEWQPINQPADKDLCTSVQSGAIKGDNLCWSWARYKCTEWLEYTVALLLKNKKYCRGIVYIKVLFVCLFGLRADIHSQQFVCLYSSDIFTLYNLTGSNHCTAKHSGWHLKEFWQPSDINEVKVW